MPFLGGGLIGTWSNGMMRISKIRDGSSILSAPAMVYFGYEEISALFASLGGEHTSLSSMHFPAIC